MPAMWKGMAGVAAVAVAMGCSGNGTTREQGPSDEAPPPSRPDPPAAPDAAIFQLVERDPPAALERLRPYGAQTENRSMRFLYEAAAWGADPQGQTYPQRLQA